MNIKYILLWVCLIVSVTLKAQIIQKYIGKSGMSAFASRSVVLIGSTNRVIVGTKQSGTGDDDAFITCVNSSDSVLWSKEVSTPNNDRFISVTATSDGGCVSVGYVNQSTGSPYLDNQAAVYKFDASGTILWNKVFKATAYGEIFYSVIELPVSHDIVCGGLYDWGVGLTNAGLIVNLSSAGTTNWAKRYLMPTGNQIMDMVYHKDKIVCLGFYRGSSYYDGQIFAIKPSDGSVAWNRSFEYTSTFHPSNQTQWGDRIQLVNDTFYLNVYLSGTWGSPTVTPTLLRLDSSGRNPFCLEYPITGNSHANVIHSKVVSSKEIYLFQHSYSAGWDRLQSGSSIGGISDVTCTKIRDMANPATTMVFSRKFNTSGQQAVVYAEVSNGKISGWGGAKNDPGTLLGNQDIFRFEADTNLTITPSNCIEDVSGQVFGNPVVSMSNLSFIAIDNITFTTPATPIVTTVSYTNSIACFSVVPNVMHTDFEYNRTGCLEFNFTDLTTTTLTGIQFWRWYFGDGGTSSMQHPMHTYSLPGTYTVKLVVTDSSGTRDSVTKILIAGWHKFAQAGNDTTVCAINGLAKVSLKAMGGISYTWSPSTSLDNPAIASPIATITGTTSYVVTVTDTSGCEDKDTVTITVSPSDFAQAGNDTTVCTLNASTKVNLRASGGISYSWSPSSGLDNPAIASPVATISGTATYVVTVKNEDGCEDSDTVTVTIRKGVIAIRAMPDDTSACAGKEIQLNATGAIDYHWDPPTGLDKVNIPNPKLTVSGSAYYVVTGIDSLGCTDRDTIKVTGHPLPFVGARSDNNIADCNEKAVLLTATGAQNYSWSPSIYCETPYEATTKARPPATLVFSVTGVDKNGCVGEDTIKVFYEGKSAIRVPNAFTPNNDQINDRIGPIIVCDFILTEFAVYNRWGNLIFTSRSITEPWDGTFNGKPCETGVYYYYIKGKDNENADVLFKGDITLIR